MYFVLIFSSVVDSALTIYDWQVDKTLQMQNEIAFLTTSICAI